MAPQPAPSPSRAERKTQTRAALKAAARERFLLDGMNATSIGAITRAAGVAHGTFYVHFESKDALLDELLHDFNRALLAELAAGWARVETSDLGAMVQIAAEVFLDTWAGERDFVAAYAARLGGRLDLAALTHGINPEVAALLQSRLGSLAGRLDGLDLPLVAQGLLAMWARVGLQFLFVEGVDRSRALDTLVPMTLGALGGAR